MVTSQTIWMRLSQTRAEFDLLSAEIDVWSQRRARADELRQYETQLKNLKRVLDDALGALRQRLDAVDALCKVSEVYTTCRRLDQRIVWLRKLWLFYREKFDQRDDPLLGPALRAADEVVWSCYATSFASLEMDCAAAPLPFFDPVYAAHAIPRVDPPSSLRKVDSESMEKTIEELPIPIIALPTICARSPWWLVFVAHEVGHHVQYDLLPAAGLVSQFKRRLEAIACEHGASSEESTNWGNWGFEVFADLFSVYCVGPAALSSIAELEFGDEQEMLLAKTRYPPPVVRLLLLRHAIDELGSLPGPIPSDADGQISRLLVADAAQSPASEVLKRARGVIQGLSQASFPGVGSMEQLTGARPKDFRADGELQAFQRTMADGNVIQTTAGMRTARLIMSAGFRAWYEIAQRRIPQQEREDSLLRLCDNLIASLLDNRPPGTRAAVAPSSRPAPDGASLARRLIEMPEEEFEMQR